MAFDFKVEKTYGVLSTTKAGWNKEFNLVSWAGREAKFDIREWSPDHSSMGKGITLTGEEAKKLYDIISSLKP